MRPEPWPRVPGGSGSTGLASAHAIMRAATTRIANPVQRLMLMPAGLDLGVMGAEEPERHQHETVEHEHPTDDAADVEPVGGARGGRLVGVGGAGRLGHDGGAERLVVRLVGHVRRSSIR
jgi:hypothetical protein